MSTQPVGFLLGPLALKYQCPGIVLARHAHAAHTAGCNACVVADAGGAGEARATKA